VRAAAILVLAISTSAIAIESWPVVAVQPESGATWSIQPKSVQRNAGEAGSFRATVGHRVTKDGKTAEAAYILVVTRCGQPRGEVLLLNLAGQPVEPITVYEQGRSGHTGSLLAQHVCKLGRGLP